MIYNFSDIYNNELYNKSKVLLVTGQYPIFNDIVIDNIKDCCRVSSDNIDTEMLSEFGYTDNTAETALNKVEYNEFFTVINRQPMNGKWFCMVQLTELSKKQIEQLQKYYKKPSDNGVLVVNMLDYKQYNKFIRDTAVKHSKDTNLIKLSFPDKTTLTKIIKNKLKGIKIEPKAIALFIVRVGTDYNTYNSLLDSIRLRYEIITYKDMLLELRGIDNYVIDDFVQRLSIPLKNKEVSKRKKIYTIQKALINDMGYIKLINKLRIKIKDLIEMRILINNGMIPLSIELSSREIKKIKGGLSEKHRLKKTSEYTFKCLSVIANKYTLRDLVIMLMILNNINNRFNEFEYAKALNTLVNRTALSKDRLLNDIDIHNTLDKILLRR